MPVATAIVRTREIRDDGSSVEMAVWSVPEPLPPSTHRFKYRLAYVVRGVCVVRYDNERGKGDHKHVGEQELPYVFVSVQRLLADFRREVEHWEN